MRKHATRRLRHWRASIPTIAALFVAISGQPAAAQVDGPIGQAQQQLVAGNLVNLQTQMDYGLVTIATGCSGTLLNRSWVLTADHCLSTNGQINGPAAPLANLGVSAAWTTRIATPTMMIRLWDDVALLYLGHGDLGRANTQLLFPNTVDTSQTITKFGRGIFAFAGTDANGNPVPALSDGLYRSGVFNPSSADQDFITVTPNGAGQIANGGDSGGPDFVTAPDGTLLGIAGVQSTCSASGYVTAMPQNWTWATGITSCSSAALIGSRSTILQIIGNRPIASNDFNDDNLPDIVWHNEWTGETQIWFMNYSSRIGRTTVVDEWGDPILVGLPWRIVASRDFDRDDRTDILWYNEATGELQIWYMSDSRIRYRAGVVDENGILIKVGLPWSVVSANDMNRDGHTDIVWHNAWTGETQIWMMKGGRIAWRPTVHDENTVPIMVGYPWTIKATDDMNQDGRADIVWHNDWTGETQIWLMNFWQITKRQTVLWERGAGAALVGSPWRITSTNDFDGDRIADIIWHNEWTGETQIWYMTFGRIRSRATVFAWQDGGGHIVGEPWRIMPH